MRNTELSAYCGKVMATAFMLFIPVLPCVAQKAEIVSEAIVVSADKQQDTVSAKDMSPGIDETKNGPKRDTAEVKTRKSLDTGTNITGTEVVSDTDDDTMMGIMGKGSDKLKLGGHVGFVVPIVARGNGSTTNLSDRFVFGFPVGLTLKTKHNIAVDFEFIPTFNTGNDFVLTIHPGIIYGFAKNYAVGVRAAYDAGADSYGFTPLISRGFKINNKVGYFIEADFPVRWNKRPIGRDRFASVAFAAHFGFSF